MSLSRIILPFSLLVACDPGKAPGTDTPTPATSLECEGYDEADYDDVPATFTAEGERGIMAGYIDRTTPDALEAFLADHPDVTVLVMPYVPGSDNDNANLRASRMVRAAGLDTCVPSTGLIASGGVDFFVAGVARAASDDALVGVHSWATGDGTEGGDLDRDDPAHDMYLDYYEEMGIPADFYWFTLEAADADGIHWMSPEEMDTYTIRTVP